MATSTSLMHCCLNNNVKIKPGRCSTLVQYIALPHGLYTILVEDHEIINLIKSHNFALGTLLITSNHGIEIFSAQLDFQKEYPFQRQILIPAGESQGKQDDANANIRMEFTVLSSAHIKRVRLSCKLLTENKSAVAKVLSSETIVKKKGKSKKLSSSNASISSATSTPSSSYTELPFLPSKASNSSKSASTADSYSSDEDESELPSDYSSSASTLPESPHSLKVGPLATSPNGAEPTEQNFDVVEKDILFIQKNTTYTNEGMEQTNTQIHHEHTKTVSDGIKTTISETSENAKLSEVQSRSSRNLDTESLSSFATHSQSSFDPTEENMVYFKETRLKKKIVTKEQIPIQQKGRYYLMIENNDKGPITRHFSCHLTLSNGEVIVKESYTNDAKKKIIDDFTVDSDTAILKLELVNTTTTAFGSTELQISLYMKNVPSNPNDAKIHPYLRTGEVVWSVNACEVEKKHPEKLSAKLPCSGRFYIVVEKVDKIYGGLREISVNATLTEPPKEGTTEPNKPYTVASVVVGGTKHRPMKWKSLPFLAPAGSVVDFYVESFALVGSITYSLRIRQVPGLTAEQVRNRQMVLLFLMIFGIYYPLSVVLSIMDFIQNIGFTFRLLFIAIDITVGRLCFVLFFMWFKSNQEILIPILKDIRENARKVIRKINYFKDMSDGGKFDILRIFKRIRKEGKANDKRKWAKQKLLTANE